MIFVGKGCNDFGIGFVGALGKVFCCWVFACSGDGVSGLGLGSGFGAAAYGAFLALGMALGLVTDLALEVVLVISLG